MSSCKQPTPLSMPAPVQRASVLVLASAFFTLCLGGRAVAQDGYNFQICEGAFALCAASTGEPTGGSIAVNVPGGGTASFPEAKVTCPIVHGPAIADLAGGNMQGSCTPPEGKIWSLYQPRSHIPQAITNWSRKPEDSFSPPQICPADLNQGDQYSQCFSFACDPSGEINGVPVATCHCPLGATLGGAPVDPHTAFATQAGQKNTQICFAHPVGSALPLP